MSEIIEKCVNSDCNNLLIIGKRNYFQHQICHKKYCIWCVYNILSNSFKRLQHNKQTNHMQIEYYDMIPQCCANADKSFIYSLKYFIQHNCITCGANCEEKERYWFQYGLSIGKKCYQKMIENTNKTSFENICIQKIQQLGRIKCMKCKYIEINFVTGNYCQTEMHVCQQCEKKYCSHCKSQECLESECPTVSYQGFTPRAKIVNSRLLLVEFENKVWCHYCVFKKMLQNKNSFNNEFISQVDFLQQQINFQGCFWMNCITCGFQLANDQKNVFLIPHGIINLQLCICADCHKMIQNDMTLNYPLKQFIKLLKGYKLLNQIKKLVQISLDEFGKRVRYKIDKLNDQLKKAKQEVQIDQALFLSKQLHNKNKLLQSEIEQFHSPFDSEQQFSQKDPTDNKSQTPQNQIQQVNQNDKKKLKTNKSKNQDISDKLMLFPKLTCSNLKLDQSQTQNQISKAVLSRLQIITQKFIHELQSNIDQIIQSVNDNQQKLVHCQNKTQVEKQKCVLYQKCRNQQQYLNLDSICDACFYKYLLGNDQIARKVQQVKSGRQNNKKHSQN